MGMCIGILLCLGRLRKVIKKTGELIESSDYGDVKQSSIIRGRLDIIGELQK